MACMFRPDFPLTEGNMRLLSRIRIQQLSVHLLYIASDMPQPSTRSTALGLLSATRLSTSTVYMYLHVLSMRIIIN